MSEISTKDLISKFKDYADIADASYAMLTGLTRTKKTDGLINLKTNRLLGGNLRTG